MRLPRWLHRWYARRYHYFWLPCLVCGVYWGGHEWKGYDDDLPNMVPDPNVPGTSWGICPSCTKAGYGYPHDITYEIWTWSA